MTTAVPDTEICLRVLKIICDMFAHKHDAQGPKIFCHLRDTEGLDSSLQTYTRMAHALKRLVKTGLLSITTSTFAGRQVHTYTPGPKIAETMKGQQVLTCLPRRKIDIERLLRWTNPSDN
jgi:hypothetical protein